MIHRYAISVFLFAAIFVGAVHAQHWQQIFTAPTVGSAAYFANPDVGCIGTGNYPGGYAGQIFYTTDGGKTWTRSQMPNMNLYGQITDIYFVDRWNGWMTLRERIEHGWSGVYKTTDGGKSWALWYQADFPVAIRQTSHGIFFTDRFVGIMRSTDGGLSFQNVAPSNGILGLDFLDDNTGIASSEGTAVGMVMITKDGGANWAPVDVPHEAWTAFADVATGGLLFASERNNTFNASGIFGSSDGGTSFSTRFSGPVDVITGGIGGPRWCRSVIYAQGEDSSAIKPGVTSMLRSVDGGFTWIRIGGPRNFNDKRFAVTGKGAVVYAFDKGGGVWKTSDGGDGTLSASALGSISITTLSTVSPLISKLCDSADYHVQLTYSDCDSLIISGIAFIDDNIGELSAPKKSNYFGKDNTRFDTLTIRFKPRKIHAATERIRITLRQPDGFLQDTLITVAIQGLPATDKAFIAEATPSDTMDFGVRSVCGDDSVRTVTITNIGCSSMNVISLVTNGPPFNLLSSFQPFSLDPGVSRTILLQFQPGVIGSVIGKLNLITSDSNVTVTLTGIGKAGTRGYKLSQPQLVSTICDSTEGDIIFKNISCTPVRLDSIGIDAPFRFDQFALPRIIQTDSSIILHIHFIPSSDGPYTKNITIHSFNDNDSSNRFDTTLTLTGFGTRGIPGIALSTTSLDFGSISTCIFRDEEVTITNIGCDTLKITDQIFSGSSVSYSVIQSAKGANILRGASTKIIIRFKPPGLGSFSSTVHLATNAGDRDIVLTGSGTNDPGTLTLTATPIGSVLTCKDSGFILTLSNTTCDSLFLDSAAFIGAASPDYAIISSLRSPMPSGKTIFINGKFSPQTNGTRSAVAHFYLHLSNGTVKEITVPLDGTGIQPVVIQLSLPNVNLTANAGIDVLLPVQLLDTSVVPVAGITVSMDMNTDLLTPQSFDMKGSVVSGATVLPLLATRTNVTIKLQLTTAQKLGVGLLGTLVLKPFVSDSQSTSIMLTDFTAFDSTDSKICLPTAIVVPPQIVTSFSLNSQCGDSSLAEFMRHGISNVMIEHIAPNPTTSSVLVTLRIPPSYLNDGIIEIFNGLGSLIQSEPLTTSGSERRIIRAIELQGASGLRLLRVRTPGGISSESVYLLR